MGKKRNKKSGADHGGEEEKQPQPQQAKAFVLKVSMHCACNGCVDKIRAAVTDITLLPGVESWDQSALESAGELRLVATADPERLRQRLRKATRKDVDLLFFPSTKDNNKHGKKAPGPGPGTDAASAAHHQALLLNALLQQQQQQGQNAWAGNQMLMLPPGGAGAGGGWNALGGDYSAYAPWAVQQQQMQQMMPDPYAAYSYGPGAAAWGGFAYPPAALGHGGGAAWQGHGY